MSTWVGVEIDGLSVEDYQNHHSNWFFKRSDRVRENCELDEDGRVPDKAFIGYRASVLSIRRRMILDGYSPQACEDHFNENLRSVIETARRMLDHENERCHAHSGLSTEQRDAYRQFLDAVSGTSLQDWEKALPEALALSKKSRPESNFPRKAQWRELSAVPLVNAMLSEIPLHTEYPHTGRFNFPYHDGSFFQLALLACCDDDAICELNIAPLIQSGYEEDFRDLAEIQRQETVPHSLSRQSVEDILRLSTTQPDNPSLQRMCYAGIITSMEAYLGDILKREVFDRPSVKERFVASYKPFSDTEFKLSDLYTALSEIDERITKALDTLSLHNIGTAKSLFHNTLMTTFPEKSLRVIGAAVSIRHDIVHRNGRNTKGEAILIEHEQVQTLANEVQLFTQNVDGQIIDGIRAEAYIDEPTASI